MAVTGTNTFTVTRNDIIKSSLRTMGVIGLGETPETEDYTNCSEALNIMIKSWAKKGFPLWVFETLELPMLTSLKVYPLGATSGYIYSVTVDDGGTGYPDTGTVSFSSGAATATYAAEDGVIQSVTVTAGGNTYTTAPTVTFSGAGTGAEGTANIAGLTVSKPLRIIDAFIRVPSGSTSNDTSIQIISQQEYDIIGNKSSEGIPNQLYYDNQLSVGYVYVYNVPQEDGNTMFLTTQRMFDDMTTGTDNFDFPQEWFQALKWGLCAELAEEYGVAADKIQRMEMKAMMYIQDSFDWSVEEASVYFTLETR